ncbi:MAG: class I SAM-dependent methyltransferase [Acidobacteriia bacterium]|nr:class I SAM-dependent methyltransferase [Terriglobia bacterium]
MSDPTKRFSDRVEDYARYRPRYPSAVVDLLRSRCGLTGDWVIADVGSGTGILSEMLLSLGCRVYGVEPNREMREAGERLLARYPGFESVDGRAEATSLPGASVDLVTAGQAFHWFDRPRTRAEFVRILKPDGWVALMWNKRRKTGTRLAEAYERLLLEYAVDYGSVDHDNVTDEVIAAFFRPGEVQAHSVENHRTLDYRTLEGYMRSASYVPAPGHAAHGRMLEGLRSIFESVQRGGVVILEYDTKVYLGRLPVAGL